jgi:hypothetical protein
MIDILSYIKAEKANNFIEDNGAAAEKLIADGDGTKFLSDDGIYKERNSIYHTDLVLNATDGVSTSGSGIFQSASITFDLNDIGNEIEITSGSNQGIYLITGYNNQNEVVTNASFSSDEASLEFTLKRIINVSFGDGTALEFLTKDGTYKDLTEAIISNVTGTANNSNEIIVTNEIFKSIFIGCLVQITSGAGNSIGVYKVQDVPDSNTLTLDRNHGEASGPLTFSIFQKVMASQEIAYSWGDHKDALYLEGNLSNPQDGEVLVYQSGKWVNALDNNQKYTEVADGDALLTLTPTIGDEALRLDTGKVYKYISDGSDYYWVDVSCGDVVLSFGKSYLENNIYSFSSETNYLIDVAFSSEYTKIKVSGNITLSTETEMKIRFGDGSIYSGNHALIYDETNSINTNITRSSSSDLDYCKIMGDTNGTELAVTVTIDTIANIISSEVVSKKTGNIYKCVSTNYPSSLASITQMQFYVETGTFDGEVNLVGYK